MDLDGLIADSRKSYRKSGKKLVVPHPPYVPSGPEWARASGLGLCELQLGYQKTGTAPDFPELTPEENPETQWIMDHGSYVAPMIQEPLMYWGMKTVGGAFEPEVPVKDTELMVTGVIDGVLEMSGHRFVVEIKDTEGAQKRSVGEPKLQYALQILCYMMMTGIQSGFIITVSKWGWNTYPILEYEKLGHFVIHDRFYNVWTPPKWMADFNTPDILNFDTVKREIEKYHQVVEQLGRGIIPPPPISLNDERGFLCFRTLDKGTKTRDALVTPNCAFAGKCHHVKNQEYRVTKEFGIKELVREF